MVHNVQEERMINAAEHILAMRFREVSHYAVPDYLADTWRPVSVLKMGVPEDAASTSSQAGAKVAPPAQIDELWRGRVCALDFGIADRSSARNTACFVIGHAHLIPYG